MARKIRRDAIARGIIPDPSKRPPRYRFEWSYGSLTGKVYADNRSDARSLIKKDLGVPRKRRLPVEIQITRFANEASVVS